MKKAVFENDAIKEFIADRGGALTVVIRDYIVG